MRSYKPRGRGDRPYEEVAHEMLGVSGKGVGDKDKVRLLGRRTLPSYHVAHSARQSHGHKICMSKQSDWDVRVTRVTNGWLIVLHTHHSVQSIFHKNHIT